ncbi:MAG: DUF4139 domain-containing protein [Paludibacteraceae bacterium]|nr:DUF4139 domain-containing protein [Paludibacteraceae bacterium]
MKYCKKLGLMLLSLLALPFSSWSIEKDLQMDIDQVTVYRSGAEVVRSADVNLPAGVTELRIRSLSPSIDPKSILVKMSNENVKLISVTHELDFANQKKILEETSKIQKITEALKDSIAQTNSLLEVYASEKEMMKSNKSIKGVEGITADDLSKITTFYHKKMTEIENEQNRLKKKKKEFTNQYITMTQKQIALNLSANESSFTIKAMVQAEKATDTRIRLTYFVTEAGWNPVYEARITDNKHPLQLTYTASVRQNVHEDWSNISIRISTENPMEDNVSPTISSDKLNFGNSAKSVAKAQAKVKPRTKTIKGIVSNFMQPLPYVCIVAKGTNLYAITDQNGYYEINAPENCEVEFSHLGYTTQSIQLTPAIGDVINVNLTESAELKDNLNEILNNNEANRQEQNVSNTPGITTESSEKKVTNLNHKTLRPTHLAEAEMDMEEEIVPGWLNLAPFTVSIPNKYTIPSNNIPTLILINDYTINATYEYVVLPKLEKKAYISAFIPDWTKYKLLDGPVYIFWNNEFKGQSYLSTNAMKNDVELSIGADKGITVNREIVQSNSSKQVLISSNKATRTWKITLNNTKDTPVDIAVKDQYPLSNDEDITVDLLQSQGASVDKSTGIITWRATLQPGEEKKFEFTYRVKYPVGKSLYLE